MTQGVAMSWLVLRLTGNGVDLGLMTACTFLPLLVFGPYAGTLVDRFDRRRLLIVTQTLLLLLAALAATLIATGLVKLWMLFVIAALTGCVSAPDGTARQVYVIDLVGTGRLASAVSLYEVVLNISRVVGPSVGGVLLATVGVGACCALNAASYLQPLFVLLRHRPQHAAQGPAAPGTRKAPPGQLRAGLRYAWRNRPIRVCLFLAAASGLLFNLSVQLPLLATRVFHLGGGGYGLMMAVFGIGALPGALLASAGPGRPTGRSVGVLALATAAAVLLHGRRPRAVAGDDGAGRDRLPLDLVHRPGEHARPAGRRSVHARPGDGPVDDGAARHRACDQPVRRLHQPDVRRPRRVQPVRRGAAADRHDRLARAHGSPGRASGDALAAAAA